MTIEALDEPLTLDNIDRAKGADTVSLAAVVPVPDEVLDALHAIDVNVISQRSAGVDKYNLDKLNELGMTLINVPHIAFYTETALDNLLSFALDESIKFIETGESGSVVNK